MIAEPNCFTRRCKHYTGIIQDNEEESTERPACDAFPNGIPDDIAYGDNPHLAPLPDQGNLIIFEPE